MQALGDVLLRRMETMSVMRQTTWMVAIALVAANLLTFFFYSVFFQERVLLDMFFTTLIVVTIGYPLGFLFIGQNVRLRRMAGELDRLARFDELTGLANRRQFMREASGMIRQESGEDGALLYIDIDHFKQLNDTHGHAAGDRVLKALGSAIAASVPAGCIAARIGGEEFTIYLSGAGLDEARRLAEAIRDKAAALRGEAVNELKPFTISIGVAVRRNGQDLEDLMMAADRRLYAAKRGGRDRVVGELAGAA